MSLFPAGQKSLKPEEIKICVLYDPVDGRIHHHHMVATFSGAHKADEKEIERRTLARAASFGTDTSALKALHVSEKECDPSRRYKVDTKTLKLVELPMPAHRGTTKPKARKPGHSERGKTK